MLRLQHMSDVMKMSADTLEDIYGDCGITPPADTQRLIYDSSPTGARGAQRAGLYPAFVDAV